MISAEFLFIEGLKVDQKKSWREITPLYNSKFVKELNPTALQKRYERELSARDSVGGSLVDKAVRIIKSEPLKPTELARRLDLDLDGLESLLDDLLNSRAAVKYHNSCLVFDRSHTSPDNKKQKMDISLKSGEWHKIGIMADPHYCSIHEQPALVEKFYRICEEEGVIAMLDAGDIFAGNGSVYKGQIQDLKIFGVDKQLQYVASIYPYASFPTYMVSGNHDLDAFKTSGVDIVERLCEVREDLHYLGKLGGYIDLDGVNCYVLHGDAGNPVARTFKMQKIIDTMPQEALPDVLALGHFHVVSFLPNYRNVIGIMPASFESQSDYLVRKGLYSEVGGVLLSVMLADIEGKKQVVRSQMEFINLSHYL